MMIGGFLSTAILFLIARSDGVQIVNKAHSYLQVSCRLLDNTILNILNVRLA
jgi:hypothetical protein